MKEGMIGGIKKIYFSGHIFLVKDEDVAGIVPIHHRTCFFCCLRGVPEFWSFGVGSREFHFKF